MRKPRQSPTARDLADVKLDTPLRLDLAAQLAFPDDELGISDKIRGAGGRVRSGQEVRILDIDADVAKGFGVFDHGGPDGDPGKLASTIKEAAVAYYDSRFDPVNRTSETRPVSDRLGWVRGDSDNRQWLVPSLTGGTTNLRSVDVRSSAMNKPARAPLSAATGATT
jgi:hypothetical protein